MNFVRTEIPDVIVCKPKIFKDERGYFCETFRKDLLFDFLGFEVNFCQDNESKSSRGVLRGLHYQVPPFAQTKLIRVIEGEILDVAVDLRRDSLFFGKSVEVVLSADKKNQLFVPRGFAHGFVVLSEVAVVAYKCDNYYAPLFDRGILYDDPLLSIDWKISKLKLIITEKDKKHPFLKNAEVFEASKSLY